MTCPANGNLGPHRCGACDNDVDDAEDLRAQISTLQARERVMLEALELAEEALTQAYVDEANCDGLHVAKGHHGPRAKNDCFELWASVPAHQEALDKVRAVLEPVETK